MYPLLVCPGVTKVQGSRQIHKSAFDVTQMLLSTIWKPGRTGDPEQRVHCTLKHWFCTDDSQPDDPVPKQVSLFCPLPICLYLQSVN